MDIQQNRLQEKPQGGELGEVMESFFSEEGGFNSKFELLRKENPPKGKTAQLPREMLRQQTKPRPAQGDLFTILPPKARKQAILLSEKDRILSQLVEGIDGGEIISKVIIALAITLYEQSQIYGTTKDLSGATEELLPYFDMERPDIKKIPVSPRKNKKDGSQTLTNENTTSLCPIVFIKLSDFTKLALGLPKNTKTDRKDRDRIREALEDLSQKRVFTKVDTGNFMGATIIGKQRFFIDPKRGAEIRLIELDSIFTTNIAKDFAVIRKDTLRRLRGRQTKITMRLLYFLLEQYSYRKKTFPEDSISKDELFSRIAIVKKYDRHPEEREADFKEALRKMADLYLLEPIKETSKGYDKSGGYYETIGDNGCLICHFKFNPNYKTEKGEEEGEDENEEEE